MLRYRKWTPLAAVLGAVACSSDSGGGGGTTKPPPEIIDVVADTNRDGVVNAEDPTDQDREDQFDTTAGSSFIANLDDDDGDQKRDADDEIVNGDADKLDLAEFRVTAWPTSPKDGLGVVRIDQEAAESVRIFKQNPDGSTVLVLGSTGACTSASD